MVFEIAPLNPIYFHNVMPYDFEHAVEKCYWQKYNVADTVMLQVLSDSPDIQLFIRDFETNEIRATIPFTEIPTLLVGQTFLVYETSIAWNLVGEGRFFVEIETPDGSYFSAPIWIAEQHTNTLLIRYRNSENNFSVVFDTDIEFRLRVEGTIQNFTPSFDDEIYNDQLRNASKLSSVPYQIFTLFVGAAQGLPDWMTDKVNRVMSCDMINIDGDDFEKTVDAEWEVIRQDEYPFAGLRINIMPTKNLYLERLKFQDEDMANTVILRRSENRDNVSGNQNFANLFRDKTVLIYLRVLRRSAVFTFRVGITPGGDEIGEFEAVETCGTYQVRYPFDAPATVYVSGLGADTDVSLIYEQLDEVGGGSGTIPPNPETLAPGFVGILDISATELELNFNLVTGLGRVGSPWQGWSICNGQNGTVNRTGRLPIGYGYNDPRFGAPGTQLGSDTATLGLNNFPEHRHHIANDQLGSINVPLIDPAGETSYMTGHAGDSGNLQYRLARSTTEPNRGLTSAAGQAAPDPIDILNPVVVSVYIMKIA